MALRGLYCGLPFDAASRWVVLRSRNLLLERRVAVAPETYRHLSNGIEAGGSVRSQERGLSGHERLGVSPLRTVVLPYLEREDQQATESQSFVSIIRHRRILKGSHVLVPGHNRPRPSRRRRLNHLQATEHSSDSET